MRKINNRQNIYFIGKKGGKHGSIESIKGKKKYKEFRKKEVLHLEK